MLICYHLVRFEVPQESIPHLRSQLLEKILVFGASPSGKLIANKLCLAMSAFIIHTVTDEWTEAVSELTSTFQSMDRLSVSTNKLQYLTLTSLHDNICTNLHLRLWCMRWCLFEDFWKDDRKFGWVYFLISGYCHFYTVAFTVPYKNIFLNFIVSHFSYTGRDKM